MKYHKEIQDVPITNYWNLDISININSILTTQLTFDINPPNSPELVNDSF